MRRITVSVLSLALALLPGCGGQDTSGASDATAKPVPTVEICNGGRFRCFARAQARSFGERHADAAPIGYGPADLASAYNLDVSSDPRATIGIIAAFGYANLESDLAAYRSQFGLPACSVASGCLTIVNQQGQASPLPGPPPSNDDWTQETALDTQMASAGCPHCKLLVVQADDDTGNGLVIANDIAASRGATVISNSWGSQESELGGQLAGFEVHFMHPGIAIFASTGDRGFNDGGAGPEYPASSAFTVAVGGTTLLRDTGVRGWTETAWDGGGAACSTLVAKPAWQASTACPKRMTADVSANGDPQTGVAVFNQGAGDWIVLGGTSAAAPLVAAIFAQTGHGGATAQYAYQNTTSFFDVTLGSDGMCGTQLCDAGTGWDGPTGNGTPNGAVLAGARPPTLVVTSPFVDAFVPAGFTVRASCTPNDSTTIKEVDITIDGEPLGKLTAAPYTLAAPPSLAQRTHSIVVTCSTSSLAQASQTFSVTQVQGCSTSSDCSDGTDVCYLGACIAGPSASNGLGATCTGDASCASGSCASDGKNAYCAVACDPSGGVCPSGFSCIPASGVSICFPSSGGGCNAGGGTPLWPAGLMMVLLIVRRRRCPR